MTAFLKIVNYDKFKFFLLDLMQILCEFLCDKAQAPLAGMIFIKTEA